MAKIPIKNINFAKEKKPCLFGANRAKKAWGAKLIINAVINLLTTSDAATYTEPLNCTIPLF
jgi:hypothetical protein